MLNCREHTPTPLLVPQCILLFFCFLWKLLEGCLYTLCLLSLAPYPFFSILPHPQIPLSYHFPFHNFPLSWHLQNIYISPPNQLFSLPPTNPVCVLRLAWLHPSSGSECATSKQNFRQLLQRVKNLLWVSLLAFNWPYMLICRRRRESKGEWQQYVDLGLGTSNPDATILLKRHSIRLTAFLPLLWHWHYAPASVAFTGLITEFLIVAL